MRWFFVLVAVGAMCLGGCSGDDSGTEEAVSQVVVHMEWDGTRCVITDSDPAFEPADDANADLIVAASGGTVKVVYTNLSGKPLDLWVRRLDTDMTVSELADFFEDRDGTRYPYPYWMNYPKPVSGAEDTELESNQRQGDFLLEPGHYVMGIYNDDDEGWTCRTSDAVGASLVEVTGA
jgi:hypothetical protein